MVLARARLLAAAATHETTRHWQFRPTRDSTSSSSTRANEDDELEKLRESPLQRSLRKDRDRDRASHSSQSCLDHCCCRDRRHHCDDLCGIDRD